MNRRAMLRGTLLSVLAAGLPYSSLHADGVSGPEILSKGFHSFKLGDLELCVVSDGSLSLGPVQPFYAPDIDARLVNSLLEANFRPTSAIALGINILVIKKESRIILIDAGTGSSFGKGSGWLPASLAAAGIAPSAVTDIVLTHGHGDHIGGLLDEQGNKVFPGAAIHLSKKERDFWMAAEHDFSRCRIKDKDTLNSMVAAAKKTIAAVADRLHLYDVSDDLLGCIRFEAAAGHTPGHMLVVVYSGREELVHVGDLVHSDVLLFPHPDWGFAGDTDFEQGISTRKRVLEALAGSAKKVMAYHLAWPGLGHVRKSDTGYQWVPETFAYPG